MSVNEHIRISKLNDYYGTLLTDRQREAISLYYDCDMSLSEIAAELNVTRQAVHDLVVRTAAKLEDYEAKLGLLSKLTELQRKLTAITDTASGSLETEIINSIIAYIKEI